MTYKIIDKRSRKNVPAWGNAKKYIAIHYLGVDGQNYDLAADGTGAHYTIYWDGTIYQRCDHDAIVWAVGTAGQYVQKHPQARNNNTISIELCCHCDGDKTSAEDKKWYFTTETQQAAVWLVQKLMKELSIPIGNVLRHYDIVNKICPAPYVHNNKYKTSWTWQEFLAKVKATEAAGIPANKQDFIDKVAAIAVDLYKETRILPRVVIAQACLENGFGLGADARVLTEANNLLGMKADLINNTWSQYTVWDGQTITKKTPEYVNGKLVYKDDTFRKYKDYENCIRDYEMFLLHVRNDLGYKYRSVQGLTDPRSVITVISRGGYATDPAYIEKVMRIIEQEDLAKYDREVIKVPEKDRYVVRRRWSEKKYQIGAFRILDNAKRLADQTWGYRVYDLENPNKAIYKPMLTRWQKLCAACVRLNQWLVDDIAAGKDWHYDNHKPSKSTFWLTRKAKLYITNCMGGSAFAMKEAGIPASACSWYGQKGGGLRYLNDHAEADLRKYADIIEVKTKTVKKAVADGTLCPGDILTLVEINHTFIYLGNGLFFDSGHAYCNVKSGDGAPFVKWIGGIFWSNYHVGTIVRLRG